MQKTPVTRGFTLIEVVVVVAIIGLLAAIAMPSYQAYITRARVTEMLYIAESAKASVSEFAVATNMLPKDANEAGVTAMSSPMVSSMEIADGVITVHASSAVTGKEDDLQIILTPSHNGSHIAWSCSSSGATQHAPATCRNHTG